jgi:hypothetical protein
MGQGKLLRPLINKSLNTRASMTLAKDLITAI